MNKEIKVGEYVRTKDGYLGKCIKENGRTIVIEENEITWVTRKNNITKYSESIIDLIEVGDYVNGYKVMGFDNECFVYDDNADDFVDVKDTFIVLGNEEGSYMIQAKEIKTIVTKEQFKEMEYKV